MNYKLILVNSQSGKPATEEDHTLFSKYNNWLNIRNEVFTDEETAECAENSCFIGAYEGEEEEFPERILPEIDGVVQHECDYLKLLIVGFKEFMGRDFIHMTPIDVHELAQGLDELPIEVNESDLYIWNDPPTESTYWVVSGNEDILFRVNDEGEDSMWILQ